jgi:prepilin-type N-terminal cleavage/methylation domain-containing protein
MSAAAPRLRTRSAGFTLIEMLAVLAMFALIAGLILPRFATGGARAVRHEAEALGEAVEFARQRAIMTARPHELVLDLDRGLHWVEWAPPPPPESEAVAAREDERAAGSRRIDMTPPPAASGELAFEPVPGAFGRAHALGDDAALVSVAFPDVGFQSGQVTIAFGPDGAADPAVVSLSDPDGAHPFAVEIEALADAVRVVDVGR